MKNTTELFQNLCLLILTSLVLVIILEFSSRIYLNYFVEEKVFLTYASLRQIKEKYGSLYAQNRRLTPHRYLGYYPTPDYTKGHNMHNSSGYRGEEIILPKPYGEFRIVCMGGSTTYTGKIEDYRLSYPYLLEKELQSRGHENLTVINAGASAWSSWETLINFELRVLDLDPDLIIVYHGVNDIHPRLVWPPEAYQGDNSGRRITNSQLFMPGIVEYSTLLRFFMIRFGIIQSHSALSRTVNREPATYYADDFTHQKMKDIYPAGIFIETSAAKMLETNSPEYFKRNIENIVTIAKYRNIRTILTTFAYSPLFTEVPRASSQEYISAYTEMNDILKSIAQEMEVNLFDFSSIFPIDKQYYTDGRHVTVEGSKLKARLFAEYIIDTGLLSNF